MIAFWIRILIVFVAACAQAAYSNALRSDIFSVDILLLLALVWMLVLGFSRAMGWIVFAGIVFDAMFFAPVGFFTAMFVSVTYAMSKFTRQFLVAHAFWGKLFLAGLVVFATGVEGAFRFAFAAHMYGASAVAADIHAAPLLREWAIVSSIQLVLFATLFFAVSRVEEYLSFYERRIKPKSHV